MAQPVIKNGKLKVKPYSAPELATVYDVCARTMRKWIVPFEPEIGIRVGRYYNITQVRIILHRLGLPASITLEE